MATPKTPRRDKAALTAALARQVQQTRVALGGAAEGLRRVDQAVLDVLVFVHQPRQIIPPDQLDLLVVRGEAGPRTVLQALQGLAAQGEPWATTLADLERLAETIRPPGQVHVPILYYRADDGAWVVYSGHRRCLASLLAGRDTVPVIEVRGRTEGERELDRIAIETAHEDWTAIEQATALRSTRDKLRAEWVGKTPAEVGLGELAEELGRQVATESAEDTGAGADVSVPGDTDTAGQGTAHSEATGLSVPGATETAGQGTAHSEATGLSVPGATETIANAAKPLTGRWLDGVVTAVMLRRAGLGRRQFYRLLALAEKLSPEAQAVAQQNRLTEKQLRPVTQLTDPVRQLACVKGIVRHGLTSSQADVLVEGVQEGAKPAAAAARVARGDPEPERYDESSACRPVHPHQTLLAQPPKYLSRRSRRHWHDLHRARAKWDWVALDPDAAVKWVQELPAADVRALYDEARETAAAFVHLAEQIHEYGCG